MSEHSASGASRVMTWQYCQKSEHNQASCENPKQPKPVKDIRSKDKMMLCMQVTRVRKGELASMICVHHSRTWLRTCAFYML